MPIIEEKASSPSHLISNLLNAVFSNSALAWPANNLEVTVILGAFSTQVQGQSRS